MNIFVDDNQCQNYNTYKHHTFLYLLKKNPNLCSHTIFFFPNNNWKFKYNSSWDVVIQYNKTIFFRSMLHLKNNIYFKNI